MCGPVCVQWDALLRAAERVIHQPPGLFGWRCGRILSVPGPTHTSFFQPGWVSVVENVLRRVFVMVSALPGTGAFPGVFHFCVPLNEAPRRENCGVQSPSNRLTGRLALRCRSDIFPYPRDAIDHAHRAACYQ